MSDRDLFVFAAGILVSGMLRHSFSHPAGEAIAAALMLGCIAAAAFGFWVSP